MIFLKVKSYIQKRILQTNRIAHIYEAHTIKSVSHEDRCLTLDSGTKVTITGNNGRTNIALYEYDPHFGSLDLYNIVQII